MKKTLLSIFTLGMTSVAFAQPSEVSLTPSSSNVCSGDQITLTIGESESWATYSLINGQGTVLDGPTQGTGGAMDFTDNPTVDLTYAIIANVNSPIGIQLDGYSEHFVSTLPSTFSYGTAFTYECWAKVPTPISASYHPFLSFGDATNSDVEVYGRNGDMSVAIHRSSGTTAFTTVTLPPNNTWFHLAVTYDGSVLQVYYDGVAQLTTPLSCTITPNSGTYLEVGGIAYTGFPITYSHQKYTEGIFDEIRLWDYARSASEISNNMSTCLAGSETGLVATYTFNPLAGTSFTDVTGNETGTLVYMDSTNYVIADGTNIPCAYDAGRTMSDMEAVTVTTVDASVTLTGYTYQALQGAATYQWVDCDNGNAPVSGETSQSFTPTVDGNYAVAISYNGCSALSPCNSVVGASIEELESSLTIYPNPAEDVLFISSDNLATQITIVDVTGAVVYNQKFQNGRVDVSNLPQGYYFIQVETSKGIVQKSFVKA